MAQELNYLKESPSQTAGPYVHIGCVPNFVGIHGIYDEDLGKTMVNDKTLGDRITIRTTIYDGAGVALKDAMIELWQADAAGFYNSPVENRGTADPNFTGWGRQPSDLKTGAFVFETIKPGSVPFNDGRPMAPHINLWIVARGVNVGLQTRLFFPEDEEALNTDPILTRIEHKNRIPTLIAKKIGEGEYAFDIYLQGENETIFFDV